MSAFFFAEESPRPAALMRIALGALLLCEAAARWPYAIELFSADGRPMPVFPGTPLDPATLGATPTVALHSLYVWTLLCATLGWNARTSLLVAAILGTWLGLHDLAGTYKKYTAISLHLLLLLSLTNCGGAWSIDAWRRRRLSGAASGSPLWPRRLMQIFLCSVYVGAALTKFRLPDFATGEHLEFALLGDQFGGTAVGRWLVRSPSALAVASVGTILFEILLFPALVWIPRLRRPVLALAALFHLAVQVAMNVGLFSWVMLVGLLAFVTDDDLAAVGACARRRWGSPDSRASEGDTRMLPAAERPRRALAGWIAWFVCGAAAAGGGLAAQRAFDWYGVFSGRVPETRVALPGDLVDEILSSRAPAYEDYVHRLEIGSRLSSGRAFGERSRFRPGTVVHAVARFVQRHPPMKLDWLLIAPDGTEAARLTRSLDASVSHAVAGFELTPDAPAGRYRLILQANGYDAAEAAFEVE